MSDEELLRRGILPEGWTIGQLSATECVQSSIDFIVQRGSLEDAITFVREELAVLESEAAAGVPHSPRFPCLDDLSAATFRCTGESIRSTLQILFADRANRAQ